MPEGDLYRFAAAADPSAAQPSIAVNGRPVALTLEKGYTRLTRRWKTGDTIQLDLPMPIRRVLAHDAVAEDRDKAAVQRGPLVYCVEGADNGGGAAAVRLPLDVTLQPRFDASLLGGVDMITGHAVVAVPYFAWANRGKGDMVVWIPH
jgi:DUF1680 family protein